MKTEYRRRLPHKHLPNQLIFITYRIINSIPAHKTVAFGKSLNDEYQLIQSKVDAPDLRRQYFQIARERLFLEWDHILDHSNVGVKWLQLPPVAKYIEESIRFAHPSLYTLICYTIMPNHVHLICIPGGQLPLSQILQRQKSFSARNANQFLRRNGKFWQKECYDHLIRAGRLGPTIEYVLDNPVKAGLVRHWRHWPYSWVNPDYRNHVSSGFLDNAM